MTIEQLTEHIAKLETLLQNALKTIESLERKVEICQTEIKILKEGGNI